MALYVLFENENTFLFLYFIWLSLNLQMCQIILPDSVYVREKKAQVSSINKMKLTQSNNVKQNKNLFKIQTIVQMKRPICMTTCANCCYDNKESQINTASNIAHLDEKNLN